MNKKMMSGLALVAAFANISVVNADYAVQIGAYAKPTLVDSAAAEKVAEVHVHESASGLRRIFVGRFRSSADAHAALSLLKAAGYSDAFITRIPEGVESKVARLAPSRRYDNAESPQQWNHLSAELRAKLVLLDGRAHIKDGDTFTPLEQYPQQ